MTLHFDESNKVKIECLVDKDIIVNLLVALKGDEAEFHRVFEEALKQCPEIIKTETKRKADEEQRKITSTRQYR